MSTQSQVNFYAKQTGLHLLIRLLIIQVKLPNYYYSKFNHIKTAFEHNFNRQ